MRNSSYLSRVVVLVLLIMPIELHAQSIPKERRVTHREKSLKPYDPFSAEEIWKRIKIPPSPFLPVSKALQSFRVAKGFRIECVASEPLVVDPIMFEFDPDGRIWAVEYRGWMMDIEGKGEGDPIGRVVVLEDTDGDTFMDKSTVFLDKLVMPRTISFVKGGVLVVEPPHLWFCRDTDGDLKCDAKELVGKYGRPGNPEHTDNGLMHALDNWMYSANSSTRHRFENGKLIEDATVYKGQWGITQDNYGRQFYNYENRPLHADLYPPVYVMRNKNWGYRSQVPGINYDVGRNSKEVFPIRVTPGVTLGGNELRKDGTLRTFTIACGPSIYRGDQYPSRFNGAAIIPEAAGNLVRLNDLFGDGVELDAKNAFGKQEWLASTDERFRPVCSRTGPDGAVYICDLYRGIIEHAIFMMPYLRHQILSRGLDKPLGGGRIYRLVHEAKPLGEKPHMSTESSRELVKHLSHPNGWWRDTAQRLLVERNPDDVTSLLRQLASQGEDRWGRVHALWTLEGLNRLDWKSVLANLGNDDAVVRSHAIRLSEKFIRERHAEILDHFEKLLSDQRPMVQLQLLLSLGECKGDRAERMMRKILIAYPNEITGSAAITGLSGRELEFLSGLVKHADWTEKKEEESKTLLNLAQAVINEANPQRISQLLKIALPATKADHWKTTAMLRGIVTTRISRQRWPSLLHLPEKPALIDLLASSSSAEWKKGGELLLRFITWPNDKTVRKTKPVLKPLTAVQEKNRKIGKAVYMASCYACHSDTGRGKPGMAPPLADSEWVNGPPDRLVKIVLNGLRGPIKVNGEEWNLSMPALRQNPLLNDDRLAGLLTYIRREWGNYGEAVNPEFVREIRKSTSSRNAQWSAEELIDPHSTPASKQSAPDDPLEKYRPALAKGNPNVGRILFHSNNKIRCAACHKIGHMGGGFVGPNLTDVGNRLTSEQILESLIDPSAQIAKGYQTILIITDEGAIHSGIMVSEDKTKVELALPKGGKVTIPKDKIDERITSSVSSMPQMSSIFSVKEVADLVAYLKSLKADRLKEDKSK